MALVYREGGLGAPVEYPTSRVFLFRHKDSVPVSHAGTSAFRVPWDSLTQGLLY